MIIDTLIKGWLDWLEHGRSLSGHTVVAYRHDVGEWCDFLKKHLQVPLDLLTLQSLEISDFRAWLAYLTHKKMNTRSIRRALSAVKSFYSYLAKNHQMSNQVLDLVQLPKVAQTLPRPLSLEQMFDLLGKIDSIEENPWIAARDRAFFILIYGTGLRISEALSLRGTDIALASEVLVVCGKGNKQRHVPVLPVIVEAVKDYLRQCPYTITAEMPLFLGSFGKKLNPSVAQRQMRKYRRSLGLPENVTPHALRHTCATHLMNNSHDLRAIQELLGHTKLSTTQIYTKLDQKELLSSYQNFHPRFQRAKD